jgi:GTPase
VGGTITKGNININNTLMLGPDKLGQFKPIIVKSMQENRTDVLSAGKG